MASAPRLRVPLITAIALAGASLTASAAPLASRTHGNVMGDGLDHAWTLDNGPGDPLAGKVCAAGDTLFGIDVSYYQGDIDWNAVAASGVIFAWTRASHALQFDDPQLQNNLNGARAAGVHIGVYQYFEPTQDPIAQAQRMLDLTGPLQPGDLPPMIDVEAADKLGKAAYADAIRAWLDHVEAATGVVPFIYSGYYYWNDYVGTAEFADHPLIIPNYNPGCPLIPDAWSTWTVHQYCDCGSIPGIKGNVDVDTFNGDLDALKGYTVGGGVCGDAKCTFGEDTASCPADCPPCGTIAPEGGTIDNGAACLELYGDPKFWREEAVGEGGSLRWTNVTEYAEPSNYAIWRMYFAETGTYALETYVQQPFGETKQSTYHVQHAGGETLVPIDQSQSSGWVSLGEYNFNSASDHFVRIDDNTGELIDLELSLVADALRITRVDLEPATTTDPSTTGPDTTGNDTTDTADTTAADTSETGDSPTAVTTTASASDTTPTSGGPGSSSSDGPPQNSDSDDGCGCRPAQRGSGLTLLLLPLALLLPRRRTHRA